MFSLIDEKHDDGNRLLPARSREKRLGLIRWQRQTRWVSAEIVRENLAGAYRRAFPNLVELLADADPHLANRQIQNLQEARVARLVVLHSPIPWPMLARIISETEVRQIVFHIFGDVDADALDWLHYGTILKNCKIKFLLASKSQRAIVRRLFGRQLAIDAELCPYPIDKLMKPDLGGRSARQGHSLKLVYAGRFIRSKNVDRLVRFVTRFNRRHPLLAVRLTLIGAMSAAEKDQLDLVLSRTPTADRKAIQIRPQLSRLKLRKVFQASRAFVSLSTYHREEFGLAPLEALCCGCDVVLSDWGGFADFARPRYPVHLVSCGEEKRALPIYADFEKILLSLSRKSKAKIETAAKIYADYSIDSVAKILKSIHRLGVKGRWRRTIALARQARIISSARVAICRRGEKPPLRLGQRVAVKISDLRSGG